MIYNRGGHYYLSANDKLNDAEYFNNANILNNRGKKRFWQTIDDKIEKFDYRRISLRPEHKLDCLQQLNMVPVADPKTQAQPQAPPEKKTQVPQFQRKWFFNKYRKNKKAKFFNNNRQFY